MFVNETTVRVRYAETDQMGFVYYGNYAQYYEVGRVSAMRELGISYKEMEEKGIIMPLASMSTKFIKPAHYDDLLTIKTYVREMPKVRMIFDYEIYNPNGELINVGETVLVFLDPIRMKPCGAPSWFMDIINEKLPEHFEK
ncbi:MAG: acyl-CoA thioesterase [Bacteroidetes bacterium]|nr:acyl-CoA thioesterase [Bacteroidota bacterium]